MKPQSCSGSIPLERIEEVNYAVEHNTWSVPPLVCYSNSITNTHDVEHLYLQVFTQPNPLLLQD